MAKEPHFRLFKDGLKPVGMSAIPMALSEEDMDRVITAMAALPVAPPQEESKPLDYYSGGLTFLSLNDVQWQCENEHLRAFL